MEQTPTYPHARIGAANCFENRWAEADRLGHDPLYTPPSRNRHYRGQYRHDSTEAGLIYVRTGTPTGIYAAETELGTLLSGQLPSGQIPNQLGTRRFDLENLVGNNSTNHSNYGQPAQEAQVALEIYHAKMNQPALRRDEAAARAYKFLSNPDVYDRLVKSYLYLESERSNNPDADDKLTGVIMPEETGCDSRPDWDFTKPRRLERKGPDDTPVAVDAANTVINYYYRLSLAKKVREAGGDMQKTREIFWVNDLEMNCVYVTNLYAMAELAGYLDHKHDVEYFTNLARKVEGQILKPWSPNPENGQGMWFPEARDGKGAFYNLDKDGQPITEVTHTNLAVLMLPNLSEQQLSSTIDLMYDEFDTRYGLPTVATSSDNYDPHYGEKESIWRGPDWANQDRRIAEALLLQYNRLKRPDFAHRPDLRRGVEERLGHLCVTAMEKHVYWAERNKPIPEFSDPDTARPYRLERVKWFAWGNVIYVMPYGTDPDVMSRVLLKHSSCADDLDQDYARAAIG